MVEGWFLMNGFLSTVGDHGRHCRKWRLQRVQLKPPKGNSILWFSYLWFNPNKMKVKGLTQRKPNHRMHPHRGHECRNDGSPRAPCNLHWNNPWKTQISNMPVKLEIWFPRLIVVPVYSQEVAGVRKEKERLTAALFLHSYTRCNLKWTLDAAFL